MLDETEPRSAAMVATYLLDIVFLLTAAVIIVPVCRAIGLGVVPGFLVAGILVGPSGLALIGNFDEIRQLAELGVVLLLFVIGIELKPARLWLMRRLVFGLGTLQVVVTGALITAAIYMATDLSFRASVVIGPALALSSTAFVLQLLAEKKLLNSEYGRASLSVLLLQDLAVVPLLALVPLLAIPELTIGADIAIAFAETLAILFVVIVGGRYLLQPIMHRIARTRSRETFTAFTVLLVLGSALLTEHLGLSMAMGAFIAGLLIADSPFRHEVIAEIEPFRGLLLGLFFMSMGMALDVGVFTADPWLSLGLLFALLAVKFIVLWPLALSFGLGKKLSAAVALLLSQSGEFGLVLFAYAFQEELLAIGVFQKLLVIIVLSMLVTPLLAELAHRLAARRFRPAEGTQKPPARAPVVLAGFGRVGRRIGRILESADMPYVAIDLDSSLVLQERQKGHSVFYGDSRRPDVLRSAGVADARLIVVTLDDIEATETVVSTLHGEYPDIAILARGHSARQCRRLLDLGAKFAVAENLEASLDLAREVLASESGNLGRAEVLLEDFRQEYYEHIDTEADDEARDQKSQS
ncbi:MAG: monovalent cation:proton antiporter-2 (CPA2) family protein [Woeseiaceae bacterium]|nr:monovalent cation:proton antiporter-2 (CPA2) family protein [Woeseiaceae bacterium]